MRTHLHFHIEKPLVVCVKRGADLENLETDVDNELHTVRRKNARAFSAEKEKATAETLGIKKDIAS